MSHFLDRLTYFPEAREAFADGHGELRDEDRTWEDAYRKRWAARQDRALHARRELHRLVLVEDLRQGRHRHLGNAADRLSAHALGHAQPRAARLLARRQLQLVSVQRQPREVPAGARPPAQALARGAHRARPGRGLGRRSSRIRREAARLSERCAASAASCARPGTRSTRSSPPPTSTRSRSTGPDRVIGFSPIPAMSMVSYAAGSRYLSLIGGVCMSFYDWYCDLPPSQPAGLGRADRRARIGRLVQFRLHHRLGLERAADAHARRALLHRGALQGRQDRGDHARLFRGRQVRRPLAASRSRAPTRRVAMAMGHVILQASSILDQRRCRTSTTTRGATPTCRCWCGCKSTRDGETSWCRTAMCAHRDFDGKLGQANNPRMEDRRLRRRTGKVVVPQRLDRLSLGPEGEPTGQVEPRSRRTARHGDEVKLKLSLLEGDRPARRRRRQVGFPYFAAIDTSISPRTTRRATCWCATCRCSASRSARRRDATLVATVFDLLVRQLRRRPRASAANSRATTTTTTRPTRRPGRSTSPACRATRSSRWRASSPTTPKRPRAARW